MEIAWSIFAALLGAVIGSFLNVVILRLPEEDASIVFPGSHCPKCTTPLRWYENIPLLSWLALRGRCRTCKAPISVQYPLVEASMAVLLVLLFQRFGISLALLLYGIFSAALLVIIFIDIHHQIIPDVLSLPGIVVGFAGSFISPMVTWQQSALGILFGGGALYAVAYGYYLATKREGMGGGDIKLLAMIGAFLGWQSLPWVIFSSSLVGSVVGIAFMFRQGKGGQTRIPFGPFLSLGALAFLLFQPQILRLWHLYLHRGGF